MDEKEISYDLFETIQELWRCCSQKEASMKKQTGLTSIEFRSLCFIQREGRSIMKTLANHLKLSSSRTTRIVDNLVAPKLIRRTSSKQDRRQYYLSITRAGKEKLQLTDQFFTDLHQQFLSAFNLEEQKKFLDFLKKFIQPRKI